VESGNLNNGTLRAIFGIGVNPLLITSSVLLVFLSFVYLFTISSYFQIEIFQLENRVTSDSTFDVYVIDKNIDQIILLLGTILWLALCVVGKSRIVFSVIFAGITFIGVLVGTSFIDVISLTSLPTIILFLTYNRLAPKKILNISSVLAGNYFVIFGILVSFLSMISSFTAHYFLQVRSIFDHNFAYDIFILLSVLSPFLIFFLIIFSPAKLLLKKLSFVTFKNKNIIHINDTNVIKFKTKIIYLLFFMFLSVMLVLIPHQPTLNNNSPQVGADTMAYVIVQNKLTHVHDIGEFAKDIFVMPISGDRPLITIFFYTMAKTIPTDIFSIIDHIPIILAPLLVLSIFFLTRELTSNDTASLLASFLTVVSFHTINGIYSGIYANWFALIFGYMSFVFLIRFLKTTNKKNLTLFSIFIILLLFSHVYTWTILILGMGIFLGILYKMNFFQRKSIFLLFLVIFSSVAVDLFRSYITGISGGVERDIGIASGDIGFEQLSYFWTNLTTTVQHYGGGYYGNFIILALVAFWIIRSNPYKLSSIFMLVFLSIAVIPLLFGGEVILSRILYNIPFQIPAAIALTYIIKKINGPLMTASICIWLLAVSIETVYRFNLILPS
jgi:hypothetical protein